MEQGEVDSMSEPRHYLEQHPTPWRLVRRTAKDLPEDMRRSVLAGGYDEVECDPRRPDADVIVDAFGNVVVETWDSESYASGFEGDVRGLVDFINAVGPSLPRLIQISREEVMRREFERRWADIELTDGDKRRIADGVRERFGGGV